MCGFAGYFDPNGTVSSEEATPTLERMITAIRHRGPDDAGYWSLPGIGLGHARLSILDLSPAGHQPMLTPDGRYVIAFNGEIYNHAGLRKELDTKTDINWRGRSDTETLLHSIAVWGTVGALERSVGMFAFALWDRQEQKLTLARDRAGEKPLYYGWQTSRDAGQSQRASGQVFLFGSELKSLRAHPAFAADVNRNVLPLYLRHNYIPAPFSIYENIFKLEPGSILEMSRDTIEPRVTRYWSARTAVLEGASNRRPLSSSDAIDQLETLLKSAVLQQMEADVPLGAFLSGGIDSSTIVALMQAQSSQKVRTFTIGFEERGYDEALRAKEIAHHLGTDHTDLYVSAREAISIIPDLPHIFDEPYADSSQIPTVLVSRLARKHVTVALSGDGGDELFGGYARYGMTASIWPKIALLPMPVRRVMRRVLTAVPPGRWDAAFAITDTSRAGDKIHKGANVLTSASANELYLGLISHWTHQEELVQFAAQIRPPVLDVLREFSSLEPFERMMAADLLTYLPDDILVKVDRASMSVSLESRVPLLDHRIIEFAWQLPQSLKMRDGIGKWILRQVLYRYVPSHLIDRPKMGFGIPLDIWLRGPLREWADGLLDRQRLTEEGYFDPAPILRKWSEHTSGVRNWAYHLWDVLMFQVWLDKQTR